MLTLRQSIPLLIVFSFFLPLGLTPLFDLDEGAFSEATREMLASGNYLTTYLQGELRFDKPILIYWLQALSAAVFGITTWAFRLPSALATTVWAYSLYRFCRSHLGQHKALTAVILFVSCLHINIIGKAAISDALLNLWITLTLFNLYHFLATGQDKNLLYAYAAAGLGVLTKGPIAILIPSATVLLYAGLTQSPRLLLSMLSARGMLCFLAIAMPWYVCEYLDQGQGFIDGFIYKHNVGRFMSAMEQHHGSVWYYLPVLFLGLMPFTGLFVHAMRRLLTEDITPLTLFMSLWFGFVLVFFSFASTKLHHYIIYGYPPLFVLASQYSRSLSDQRWLTYPILAIFALLICAPALFSFALDWIHDDYVQVIAPDIIILFSHSYQLQLLICATGAILPWYTQTGFSLHWRLLLTGVFFSIAVNYILAPQLAAIEQLPIQHAASYIKSHPQQVTPYQVNLPSFSVYSQQLLRQSVPVAGDTVLLRAHHLNDFQDFTILFYERGIYLINLARS
jgi:4-amino-4-deoxy-L-arabinose transferase-like glycosyltransferase